MNDTLLDYLKITLTAIIGAVSFVSWWLLLELLK